MFLAAPSAQVRRSLLMATSPVVVLEDIDAELHSDGGLQEPFSTVRLWLASVAMRLCKIESTKILTTFMRNRWL